MGLLLGSSRPALASTPSSAWTKLPFSKQPRGSFAYAKYETTKADGQSQWKPKPLLPVRGNSWGGTIVLHTSKWFPGKAVLDAVHLQNGSFKVATFRDAQGKPLTKPVAIALGDGPSRHAVYIPRRVKPSFTQVTYQP